MSKCSPISGEERERNFDQFKRNAKGRWGIEEHQTKIEEDH
jgi:hypothetical protein